jgi:hypothetical protein
VKNHTNDCEILTTGVCTCMVTSPHPHPKITATDIGDFQHRFGRTPDNPDELRNWISIKSRAGTSRTVDTEPKVTWLGGNRFVHPPTCSVHKATQPNWAPFCDCWIADMQKITVPFTDPGEVPAGTHLSRAPSWVWALIGFGAGLPLGAWAGWPSW